MKKRLIIYLLSSLPVILYGQMTSPTPNAASFAQQAMSPVNIYNGMPGISIPIANIQDDGTYVPISLSYNSGGIKVEQEASWVGLGWNLNVGGVISKMIIGKEDTRSDFSQINSTEIYNLAMWPKAKYMDYFPQPLPTEYSSYYNGIVDGEMQPDIFYFNFYGYSGQFILDYRDMDLTSPYTEDNIKPFFFSDNPGLLFTLKNSTDDFFSNNGWKVTTPDGTVFTFDVLEEKSDPYSNRTSISFYLSKIQFPSGKYADFAYHNITTDANSLPNYSEFMVFYDYPNQELIHNCTYDTYIPKYLSSITTPNYTINFTLGSRYDIEGEKALSSITIINGITSESQTYNFGYSYFEGSTVGSSLTFPTYGCSLFPSDDILSKRLKLNSLQLPGVHTFTFEYNSTQLPKKTSFARDFWGYYNGQDNTTLIPKTCYFADYDPKYNSIASWIRWNNLSANRRPDEESMKAGMLQKIISPTGGITEYIWESHTFGNYKLYPFVTYEASGDIPGGYTSTGGGLRIKQIKTYTVQNSLATLQAFYYNSAPGGVDGPTTGKLMSQLRYIKNAPYMPIVITGSSNISVAADAMGSMVGYDKVTIKNLDNYGIPTTGYTENYYRNSAIDYYYGLDNTPIFGLPTYPVTDNGQLLSEKVYDNQGELKKETTFTYSTLTNTGYYVGASGYETGPDDTDKMILFYWNNSKKRLLGSISEKVYDNGGNYMTSSSSFEYNAIGQQIKSTLTTTGSNIEHITETLYAYDYVGADGNIISMQNDHCYTPIIQQDIKKKKFDNTIETVNSNKTSYTYVTVSGKKVFLPWKVWQSFDGTNYTLNGTLAYDLEGHLIQKWGKDGVTTSFIWGYNKTKVVAEVVGATHAQAIALLVPDIQSLTGAALRTELNKIRTGIPSAYVTTYTYDSMFGVTSATDANGVTISNVYDSQGRLFRVLDEDGNVIKETHYNTVN